LPSSGTVAGSFAGTDTERRVCKPPAAIESEIVGVHGLSYTPK
jgi:hypothetical protein